MTLETLYALVEGVVVALLNQVLGLQINAATKDDTAAVITAVETEATAILVGPTGLQEINVKLDGILTNMGLIQADLQDRIATRQSGSDPVILPVSPPSGYGGPTVSDVWGYTEVGSGRTQGYWQVLMGGLAQKLGGDDPVLLPISYPGGFCAYGPWNFEASADPRVNINIETSTDSILSTDANYAAWLGRIHPTIALTYDESGHWFYFDPISGWVFRLNFGPEDFAVYKAARFPGVATARQTPPAWPGLALVTLGALHPLETDFILTEPMDGVLVQLITWPPDKMVYHFGDADSHAHCGALAFQNDDFDMGHWQELGFEDQVYCPKEMTRAAAVKWRIVPGITGFIQSWTINP